jgi:hypothetical protein
MSPRGRLAAFLAWVFLFATVAVPADAATSADGAWTSLAAPPAQRAGAEAWIRPDKSTLYQLDSAALLARLKSAPMEFSGAAKTAPLEIELPGPDGKFARFRVVESPVMEPGLAAQFPEIKTYAGQGVDDLCATARFDWTPQGFHASVLTPAGCWYVDPYWKNDPTVCSSYYKRDLRPSAEWHCDVPLQSDTATIAMRAAALAASGTQLRTYRLACAATGEYTIFQGGTVAQGQAAIVTAVNRVTQVYEADFSIRLTLVANNSSLVYTTTNTDPYHNTNANLLLSENQSNIDSVIGDANYDIGHVVGTGGGGLAYLGVVCQTNWKARGETGSPSPTGDAFYIDYVAHEMGHQFGGNHSFNGVTTNCSGGNRNASTAMEPGSGSTIMAYAGICGADNLQAHSDPYFHCVNYDEIIAYSTTGTGNSCPVVTSTGNTPPTVSAGANYAIPISTPFTLTATGGDANGDALTYCWEERDLGAAQLVTDPDNGASPIFRSFNPTTSPSRTFPRLSDIINNTATVGEKMPAVARSAMKFRVTVRDNRAGGGGVNTADMQLQVVGTAGPFRVTSPNTAVSVSTTHTVTWNVAGTTASPISTANVSILLSTDGGWSFPTTLLASTPNDGSEEVTLPNISTATARIKVQALGNVYWDMSDANFTITAWTPVTLSHFRTE